MVAGSSMAWVVLTMGNRPADLDRAVSSLDGWPTVVVSNGAGPGVAPDGDDTTELVLPSNSGIASGRDSGARTVSSSVVGFLDDDAVASPGVSERIMAAFASDPRLGAVALRLVDEDGQTARRHVPRFGGADPERGGEVALFLGGACAIRRTAYEEVGGYWAELFYGHEELELSWRLVDGGWHLRYLPEAVVFHPRTQIGRHAEGWRMTGRNRVLIARRSLPWPLGWAHSANWLILGVLRAPGRAHRSSYVRGWCSGWRHPVDRRPIRWRTVWRLTRLGRPPML